MARAPYGLSKYATSAIKSFNGTEYTMTFWWDGTGAANTWSLGPDGLKIKYQTDKLQDRNSPILTSICELSVMVEDFSQRNFLESLRNDRNERDVWITLKEDGTGDLIWCGYVILDLETREDMSFPYETKITAIDGLSTLKEIPFVRETNATTGATPTFPYVADDTFINAGFRRIIGADTSWLKILLDNTGMLLASDATSTLENYTIQTSFNWWHEDMNVGPQLQYCPLSQMRISIEDLYKEDDNGFITPPSTYEVLERFCKNMHLRLFYWKNTFHFVQIDEYNTDEQDVAPFTTPINIPTREFYYTGASRQERNYLGDNGLSLYSHIFENATSPSEGFLKLSGTKYTALPAIKRVKGVYNELASSDKFNGFPLYLTHNVAAGLPTTWPTDGVYYEYLQIAQNQLGDYKIMQFTDAHQLSGFSSNIYLDWTNTCNTSLKVEFIFTIRAKPSGSSWGDADNKVLFLDSSDTLAWKAYEFPLLDNEEYMRTNKWVQPGNNTYKIFDSFNSYMTSDTDDLIPVDSAFIGQWDFQFYTFTGYDSNASFPMKAQGYNSPNSSGRVFSEWGSGTNFDGDSTSVGRAPTDYQIDYLDTLDAQLNYVSYFTGVQSTSNIFGVDGLEVWTEQGTSDTFEYNLGYTNWGDGSGANTASTIQVYNGTDWVFVDSGGSWAKGIYVWNAGTLQYDWSTLTYDKRIMDLLLSNILYNQSKSLLTLNTGSALSEVSKYYSGTTKLKFMNPCGKLTDVDGKDYIMMRGTFNLVRDEWDGEFTQVKYAVPASVITGDRDLPAPLGLII